MPIKKKTFLITGGTGFLGCHIAQFLLGKGHRVKLLDTAPLTEPDLLGLVENYQGDVRNPDLLNRLTKGVDIIIHTAAALPLARSSVVWSVTVDGTANVLEIAKKNKVERVVYICSTAVYGVPEKHPILESDPLVGVGAYGRAKIAAEKICEVYRRQKLIVPIIRPKTFIGTGRLGVFQILFDWVRRGCRIPVIGSGKNRYQLLDVEDLVNAIYLVSIKSAKLANDNFNVGAKKFGTVEEDLTALFEFAKSGSAVLSTPASAIKKVLATLEAVNLSPLYRWVYATADRDSYVSTAKIEKRLGWKPKYSNADTLIRTYDWYLQHYQEYEKATGITHRVAWRQGALKLARWVLQKR